LRIFSRYLLKLLFDFLKLLFDLVFKKIAKICLRKFCFEFWGVKGLHPLKSRQGAAAP
jgi:hypothetical protein